MIVFHHQVSCILRKLPPIGTEVFIRQAPSVLQQHAYQDTFSYSQSFKNILIYSFNYWFQGNSLLLILKKYIILTTYLSYIKTSTTYILVRIGVLYWSISMLWWKTKRILKSHDLSYYEGADREIAEYWWCNIIFNVINCDACLC